MKIKYALIPGTVISEDDGQRHYINASMLAGLYRIPLGACIIVKSEYDRQTLNLEGLTILRPCADGNYKLPPEGNTP